MNVENVEFVDALGVGDGRLDGLQERGGGGERTLTKSKGAKGLQARACSPILPYLVVFCADFHKGLHPGLPQALGFGKSKEPNVAALRGLAVEHKAWAAVGVAGIADLWAADMTVSAWRCETQCDRSPVIFFRRSSARSTAYLEPRLFKVDKAHGPRGHIVAKVKQNGLVAVVGQNAVLRAGRGEAG